MRQTLPRLAALLLAAATFRHLPCAAFIRSQTPIPLSLSGITSSVESDKPAIYYSPNSTNIPPLLIGNDGSPTGGFKLWKVPSQATPPSELQQLAAYATGRTKLVTVVYGVAGKDWIVTIAQPDSRVRVFEVQNGVKLELGMEVKEAIGDWSALCTWTSGKTGMQYLYLFGKGKVLMFLMREVRTKPGNIELVEVQTFPIPIEAETCTITPSGIGLFGANSGILYSFTTADSTSHPTITEVTTLNDEIVGLSIYHGMQNKKYLLLALPDLLEIFSLDQESPVKLTHMASASLPSEVNVVADIVIYQNPLPGLPHGFVWYAAEGKDDAVFFAVSSLSLLFATGSILFNPEYNPRQHICPPTTCKSPTCPQVNSCSYAGFCLSTRTCSCFAGSTGTTCANKTCPNNCSGPSHGSCIASNTCQCKRPWGGIDCATLVILAEYETDTTSGRDGDDPAIWIHRDKAMRDHSKIIATTKSKEGEGLAVFTLKGKLVQHISAPEPNNVDVIYALKVAGRDKPVDLVIAGCRGDDTICMFEITLNGTLTSIPGGSQPLPEDFSPYGSCVYHSRQGPDYDTYIFINSKEAVYLQYRLTSRPDGTLAIILVRQFNAGKGGQVEGCVVDDENSVIFIGEEQLGVWAYPAEPDSDPNEGYLVDNINGNLSADVEGVALIYGPTQDKGYLLVSCQGISAYSVYNRASPHEFILRFSLGEIEGDDDDEHVDRVTNTDGIAATGVNLVLDGFEYGMIVVHDDVNETPDGVSEYVSFKIVGIEDVFDQDALGEEMAKKLLAGVGRDWDPRVGR